MPLRLHSMPAGQGCPMNGSSALGSKAGALKGLGAKTGSGAGLGLGQCNTTTVGKIAVGAKGVPMGWGAGAGTGAGTGLGGIGPCGTAVGKVALGAKSATPIVWSTGAGAASGHGISLGLGLGLGAWGPVLLGAGIAALGYYLYANRNRKPIPNKDELAVALNDAAC
jgi:hypothetical protein